MQGVFLIGLVGFAGMSIGASTPRPISEAVTAHDRVVLPLTLRHGFPLVAGSVNGRAGYFMLDTGTPYVAFLNSDYLRLPRGKEVARGAAGSGQKIVVSRHDCMKSLMIAAAYTLDSLCELNGSDLRFVAKEIEPRFLGFIGYGLFKSYRLSVDFVGREAILSDRSYPTEQGAVATFRFHAEDHRTPRVELVAGAVTIVGYMDTGDEGHISLTQADADALVASGRLERRNRRNGEPHYVLRRIDHDGVSLDSTDLPVVIAAKNDVVLGFRFLKRYRSVWDFNEFTVRLYRPRSQTAFQADGDRHG